MLPFFSALARWSREGCRRCPLAGAYGLFVLPEIPLAGDGHRQLCGDPLRSSHRRLDDIRRLESHAVCVFSLERISTTKLVFCLYLCKRVLHGVGGKL